MSVDDGSLLVQAGCFQWRVVLGELLKTLKSDSVRLIEDIFLSTEGEGVVAVSAIRPALGRIWFVY